MTQPLPNLNTAIIQADLPAIIDQHFPNARRKTRVKCVWRDGLEFSGWLYRWKRDGRWRLRDFGGQQDFDGYDFLTRVLGYSKAEAVRELLNRAGLPNDQAARSTRQVTPASISRQHNQIPPLPKGVVITLQNHLEFRPRLIKDLIEGFDNLKIQKCRLV